MSMRIAEKLVIDASFGEVGNLNIIPSPTDR